MAERHFLGVDLGSTTAKSVLVDEGGGIVASSIVAMGAVSRRAMEQSVATVLDQAGLTREEVTSTISTGYGRRLVPGVHRSYTEITCHARGTAQMCPGVRLVIDVGGQDSKAITVDADGLVEEFAMNDRCASGTGRFYEVLARALECEVAEVGPLALRGTQDLEVSSMCATFAETEIISLLAQGHADVDIAASVHRAIAARTLALVAQVGRHTPVVLTGGVAQNPAAVHFLAAALSAEVRVPQHPQITGAFGAALLARDCVVRDTEQGAPTGEHAPAAPPPVADVPGADHLFPHSSPPGHSCVGCDGILAARGPVDLGGRIGVRSP